MKFYLGVTDYDWYTLLSKQENEDINFWQPAGKATFRAIRPGAPFLFKLKHPHHAIGGVGFFSSHSLLPLDVAWDIFGTRNGVASYLQFRQKIVQYRNARNAFADNPNIGCIVLTDPIFFRREDWIPVPENWHNSIVQGKTYSMEDEVGNWLWQRVEGTLDGYQLYAREDNYKNQLILEEPAPPAYRSYLTKVRLGQGAFRVQLTDAYQRRCSISGEKTLPALEAAHIKPYAESGPHFIANGLLMRADLHKLFDSGYLTITTDYRIEVSPKIKEKFQNGKEYYRYHGSGLQVLPRRDQDRPDKQYIEWHNANLYNG